MQKHRQSSRPSRTWASAWWMRTPDMWKGCVGNGSEASIHQVHAYFREMQREYLVKVQSKLGGCPEVMVPGKRTVC